MRVLKSFLPIIILIIVSIYGYQKYDLLPVTAKIGITYLTHMLALIVAGLSIRFSRASVFFYVFLALVVTIPAVAALRAVGKRPIAAARD